MPTTENDLRRHGAQAPVNPAIEAQLRLWIEQAPAEGSPGRRTGGRPVRSGSRLRRAAPLIAIPVTAAVIAGAVFAATTLRQHDSTSSPAATTGAPSPSATDGTGAAPLPTDTGISWRWLFSIGSPPAGWAVVQEDMYADHQEAILQGPSSAICTVQVFAAGAYDTARIGADATPVTVNGTEGAFATSVNAYNHVGPTVSWQYAPGAYALSICVQGSVDVQGDELALASALTAQQRPFAVPFAVGYLPPGMAPWMASAPLGDPTGTAGATLMVAGPDGPNVEQYSINLSIDDEPGLDGAQMITVNTPDGPRQAGFRGGHLEVLYDGFQVTIGALPIATSPDELIRIAETLKVAADPDNRATWFDAQEALP